MDAISEALTENGIVIVTGCLGGRGEVIKENYPEVLAVTGPNALDEVMVAIYTELLPEHDPYTDLVPPCGIKLTPRHDAMLI